MRRTLHCPLIAGVLKLHHRSKPDVHNTSGSRAMIYFERRHWAAQISLKLLKKLFCPRIGGRCRQSAGPTLPTLQHRQI
jgi:hypothetical protein